MRCGIEMALCRIKLKAMLSRDFVRAVSFCNIGTSNKVIREDNDGR